MKIFLQADRPATIETLRNIPESYGILIPCTASKNTLLHSAELPHERMIDSGIFTRTRKMSPVEYLNTAYRYGFNYVLSQDELFNNYQTNENFWKLEKAYIDGEFKSVFKLIPILQGEWLSDYKKAAEVYKNYDTIAVGGLLRNHIHNRQRRVCERLLKGITYNIVPMFKKVFLLGAYAPSREDFFIRRGVWASDFKGWQFRYKFGCTPDERNRQIRNWLLENTAKKQKVLK